MTETEIHGIPIHFQEVDNPDQKLQPADKSFTDLKQEMREYLSGSDAVKKAAPKIKRIEIGTIAHFYFKDGEKRFHCNKYDNTTTLNRCQDGCVDWNMADMECSAEAMGDWIEHPEKHRDKLIDTMHVMRIVLK